MTKLNEGKRNEKVTNVDKKVDYWYPKYYYLTIEIPSNDEEIFITLNKLQYDLTTENLYAEYTKVELKGDNMEFQLLVKIKTKNKYFNGLREILQIVQHDSHINYTLKYERPNTQEDAIINSILGRNMKKITISDILELHRAIFPKVLDVYAVATIPKKGIKIHLPLGQTGLELKEKIRGWGIELKRIYGYAYITASGLTLSDEICEKMFCDDLEDIDRNFENSKVLIATYYGFPSILQYIEKLFTTNFSMDLILKPKFVSVEDLTLIALKMRIDTGSQLTINYENETIEYTSLDIENMGRVLDGILATETYTNNRKFTAVNFIARNYGGDYINIGLEKIFSRAQY